MEANERLLAVDKDEEEEDEDIALRTAVRTAIRTAISGVKISSRKLICVEEASNVIMLQNSQNPQVWC